MVLQIKGSFSAALELMTRKNGLWRGIALLVTSTIAFAARAERINQEGRILGPAPIVTTPTLFNTPQADAIVSAMQIMPLTNPWNEDISRRPVLVELRCNDRADQKRSLAEPAEPARIL